MRILFSLVTRQGCIFFSVIQMPDAYGAGEFRATMNIYTDISYREAYINPPILNPDETIFVGEFELGVTPV